MKSSEETKNIKVGVIILEFGDLIDKTLSSLKRRLTDGQLKEVQQGAGFVTDMEFVFNPPATEEEIHRFSKENNWYVPKDYKKFLLQHNGAKLFVPSYIGGGVELFSLDQVVRYYEVPLAEFVPRHIYPIGRYMEIGYLAIDSNKGSSGDKAYMVWIEDLDEPKNINMSFELWLDRFVIAQGDAYWTWNRISIDTYYRSHGF